MSAGAESTFAAGDGVLAQARAEGILSALDHRFAECLAALEPEADEGLRWSLALACRQESGGHVCADLPRLVREGLLVEAAEGARSVPALQAHPDLDRWLEALRASALVSIAGSDNEATARPLVLDEDGRLYLQRAYRHQTSLARRLCVRVAGADLELDRQNAEASIARLVPGDDPDDEWPREALRVGLARPLSIVTGGPGTGKTTMVARLCGLLHEQARSADRPAPRVRLLAPTGKAAAAMAASFARLREAQAMAPEIREALPSQAETIQRALHRKTRLDALGRPRPARIEADLVVVDEASMVDLAWMDRLFEACESVPRLVLLGDPDQLASVRAGAVLAELCALAEPGPAVSDERREGSTEGQLARREGSTEGQLERREGSTEGQLARSVVRLRRSHRFAGGGGIGRLAEAIRKGDADEALALLSDSSVAEVSRVSEVSGEQVEEVLLEASGGLSAAIEAAGDPESKLARATGYRVLCAHRRGPLGAERLAARLDESLARVHRTTARAGWFAGQLLLVTRNAPDQDLWNGDVGLVGESDRGLRAFFADGRGGVRALSSGRLPAHESAIAMTVHKSQGSEFDRVDLVLGEHDSRLMTRELLYTGVTRARELLRIHASEDLLRAMIGRRIERDSGLAARIRGDDLDSSTPSRGGRA